MLSMASVFMVLCVLPHAQSKPLPGPWRKDIGPRRVLSWSSWARNRSFPPQGTQSPSSYFQKAINLQQHGVDKMFWLEPGSLTAQTTNVIYLCRPTIKHAKVIAGLSSSLLYVLSELLNCSSDQVKRHVADGKKHTYSLFLVPRVSTLVSQILEEEGVLGDISISSYELQLIPIADDVVSMEDSYAFKDIWVVRLPTPYSLMIIFDAQDGDETVIYNASQALITLQKLHGVFPRIVGKGDRAGVSNLLHWPASLNSLPSV